MNKRIAVYGTLRKGFGNNRYFLNGLTPLSREIVNIPFTMVSLGGFPGLVPSETPNNITIEIYEVTDAVYKSIEQLEGYPSFYQKATITTSLGDMEIYVLLGSRYKTLPVVKSGDWAEYNGIEVALYEEVENRQKSFGY